MVYTSEERFLKDLTKRYGNNIKKAMLQARQIFRQISVILAGLLYYNIRDYSNRDFILFYLKSTININLTFRVVSIVLVLLVII